MLSACAQKCTDHSRSSLRSITSSDLLCCPGIPELDAPASTLILRTRRGARHILVLIVLPEAADGLLPSLVLLYYAQLK